MASNEKEIQIRNKMHWKLVMVIFFQAKEYSDPLPVIIQTPEIAF